MRYYAVIEKGKILETTALPWEWKNTQEAKIAHPLAQVVEISKEDYELSMHDLALFEHDGKKMRARSATERKQLIDFRNDWKKYNTREGLKTQIETMQRDLSEVKRNNSSNKL